MAKYRIILTWNNQRVLEGTASGVITWENIRHFMIENFAGLTKSLADQATPTLVDIMNAEVGQEFHGSVGDKTGHAQFDAERIE